MITVIASAGEIVAISGFHTGKQIRRKKKLLSKELQDCVRTTGTDLKILLL